MINEFPSKIDKSALKTLATKALRHQGYIYYSFFVPWCLVYYSQVKFLNWKAMWNIPQLS